MATTKTAERITTTQAAPKQASTGNLPAQQTMRGAPASQQSEPKQLPPIVQFREYVNARMMTLEETLPPHINPTYFVSAIMVALQKKPSLLKCTFASIWNACVEAAKDGLLPDNKEGAIVPYGENADGKRVAELATWMPMIEGYRKKIFETGKVLSWEVQVVREKDNFEYQLGDNAFISHRPYIGTQNPGNLLGAYSIAKLSTGEIVREVMGAYDIMRVASKSKAGNGPWKDPDFVPEMARKVVGRRHYKQLPHSRELSDMIARDDHRFGLDIDDKTEVLPPSADQPRATRRVTGRQALDTYAGSSTVDAETGEVFDDGDFQSDDRDQAVETEAQPTVATTKQEASPAPTRRGASKEAGASAASPAPTASASNQQQAPAPADASPGAGAATTEAGATSSAPAPASDAQKVANPSGEKTGASGASEGGAATTGSVPAASPPTADDDIADDGQSELWKEDDVAVSDGSDRPWPPGTLPTNEAEYERYLDTQLAAMTDGAKVAPWWNGQEQKILRDACKVVRFKELQDKAIARRRELTK